MGDCMEKIELNRIYNMDCLDGMQEIEDKSIDLILCDLPYGTTSCSWDTIIPLKPLWEQYERIIKEISAIVLTASQPFSSALVMSNPLFFKHEWIWIKNRGSNFANTVREPFKEHEHILVFSKGKWTYNKQMQERTGAGLDRVKYDLNYRSKSDNYREFEGREKQQLSEMRIPSSWQKFNTDTSGLHPTIKPIALFEYLIKTYSNKGNLVLDNCMGSGTTAEACIRTGRQFIGFEKEKVYFDAAQIRIKKAQEQGKISEWF